MPIDVGLTPVYFKGRALAGMTLTTGAYTLVNLDTPKFTAPRPFSGFVSAAVLFDSPGATTTNPGRAAVIYQNGAILGGSVVWGIAGASTFQTLTLPVLPIEMGTNDILELRAYGALTGTKLYADAASGPGSVMTIWERS